MPSLQLTHNYGSISKTISNIIVTFYLTIVSLHLSILRNKLEILLLHVYRVPCLYLAFLTLKQAIVRYKVRITFYKVAIAL